MTWEALERAGHDPHGLEGQAVGVFLGVGSNDYEAQVSGERKGELKDITGNGRSFIAGRLSYAFGFRGPSMAIDTACSSSLVALHLACQSLRQGESTLAVVGGVNLMLSPFSTQLLNQTKALAPDGRCKAFDASADGFDEERAVG